MLAARTSENKKIGSVSSVVDSLGKQITVLEKAYERLQLDRTEVAESGNCLEKLRESASLLNNKLYAVRQKAIKYLTDYVGNVSLWEQLSRFYIINRPYINGGAEGATTVTADIIEGLRTIDRHKRGAEKVMQFMRGDNFLEPFLSLYYKAQIPITQEIENESKIQLGFLRFFLRSWGRHAEDNLIHNILNSLKEYDHIPSKIEIYGSEDLCFQCQVKLQWLANNLANMIIEARERNESSLPPEQLTQRKKLKILYYAKKEFKGPCLVKLPYPSEEALQQLVTRTKSEENRILVFKFTEGAYVTPPIVIEADAPPRKDFNVQLLWSPERDDSDSGPQLPISIVKLQ